MESQNGFICWREQETVFIEVLLPRSCIPRKASPKLTSVYFQWHFLADFPGHKDAGINSIFLPKMYVCVCWRHLF